MSKVRAVLPLLAMTVACSGKVSGTTPMLVLSYDPTSTQYQLVAVDVTTLHNLRTLQGGAAQFVRGSKIKVDPQAIDAANPQAQSQFDSTLLTKRGSPPNFDYFSANGVIHPADAEALAMATTYYNVEQAQAYFEQADPTAAQAVITVQFDATVTGGVQGPLSPLTDDALSEPFYHELVVNPGSTLSAQVPPCLQIGVVGHRYAHAVFQQEVFPGGGLPWLETKLAMNPTVYGPVSNLVRSLDEGMADYFGASIANDPAFVRTAPGMPDPDRQLDVSAPRCATMQDISDLQTQSRDQYDPYALGSVLSAILWDLSTLHSYETNAMNAGLLQGMKDFGTHLQMNDSKESLGDALGAFAMDLPSDLQARACGEFLDRFHLTTADIPSCMNHRTPEPTCAPSP